VTQHEPAAAERNRIGGRVTGRVVARSPDERAIGRAEPHEARPGPADWQEHLVVDDGGGTGVAKVGPRPAESLLGIQRPMGLASIGVETANQEVWSGEIDSALGIGGSRARAGVDAGRFIGPIVSVLPKL